MLATRYKIDGVTTPPFLQLANVPASNAFNPFGTTVRVSGLVQGAETLTVLRLTKNSFGRLSVRAGEIGKWTWELTALTSRDRGSQNLSGQPNTPVLNAALASSNPATALNPFVDGPMASPDVLASIYSNANITSYKADSNIVNGFVRGPLLELPAGPLTAVLGAEYQKNTFDRGFNASQTDKALFAELRAPLLAGTDGRGGKREVLALQGAVATTTTLILARKRRGRPASNFGPSRPSYCAPHMRRPSNRRRFTTSHPTPVDTVGLSPCRIRAWR